VQIQKGLDRDTIDGPPLQKCTPLQKTYFAGLIPAQCQRENISKSFNLTPVYIYNILPVRAKAAPEKNQMH
jgi:hypothetical protein